jgi:uroporphyrin-III C-methyltransferase
MTGTVYLVGAGPGSPDLLTLRAAQLLGEADVVFYDALVPQEILAFASHAKLFFVGKRHAKHSTAQNFINKRLLDAARQCKVVVRLKGGDPMLFGRAQEEIAFLKKNRIRVEVVPGITAASAASAQLGVSLTRRGMSRSVVFATPRAGEGEERSAWAKAVAAADTAALYMAAHDVEAVRDELLRAGLPPETPVVVAENISLPGEQTRSLLLKELTSLKAEGPVLLLFGEVFAQEVAAGARIARTASQAA